MSAIGRIFFISNGTAIKIGFTRHEDATIRLRQLQTASSVKLFLLYVIEGSMQTETYLHRYFGEEYRLHGEWYDFEMVYNWIKRDKLAKRALQEEG